jgi:hypothetical protein
MHFYVMTPLLTENNLLVYGIGGMRASFPPRNAHFIIACTLSWDSHVQYTVNPSHHSATSKL